MWFVWVNEYDIADASGTATADKARRGWNYSVYNAWRVSNTGKYFEFENPNPEFVAIFLSASDPTSTFGMFRDECCTWALVCPD